MRLGILFLISLSVFAEKYFPDERWETAESDQVGLDQEKVDKLFKMTFEDEASMGAVLIKDGYIIQEQYAEGFNENSFGTSWSTAKSFYRESSCSTGFNLSFGRTFCWCRCGNRKSNFTSF